MRYIPLAETLFIFAVILTFCARCALPLLDGAFSNNLPLLDEHTVTVSPFGGESDICPRDRGPHILQLNPNLSNTCIRLTRRNMRRMGHIVMPGRIDFMASICQQGYDDAVHFLRCNNFLEKDPATEGLRQEACLFNWLREQHRDGKLQHPMKLIETKEAARQKDQQTAPGDEAKMVTVRRYRFPLLGYGFTGTLLTRTWGLLSRLGVPPMQLERIRLRSGRRMTLFGQPPIFHLPVMQAPGSESSAEAYKEEVKATNGEEPDGGTSTWSGRCKLSQHQRYQQYQKNLAYRRCPERGAVWRPGGAKIILA